MKGDLNIFGYLEFIERCLRRQEKDLRIYGKKRALHSLFGRMIQDITICQYRVFIRNHVNIGYFARIVFYMYQIFKCFDFIYCIYQV